MDTKHLSYLVTPLFTRIETLRTLFNVSVIVRVGIPGPPLLDDQGQTLTFKLYASWTGLSVFSTVLV